MARTCTICRHGNRQDIDFALVNGADTLRGLASRYSVSATAVRRHRDDHVPDTLKRARQLDSLAEAASLAEHIQTLRQRTIHILARAESEHDTRGELAALRELRALAELEARGSERSPPAIHVSVVQQYVLRVIEIVRDFVPAERLVAVIARLEATLEQPELNIAPPSAGVRRE